QGGLLPATRYAVGGNAGSVAVGDMDGDGYPDVVIVGPPLASIGIFFNNGDGTFAPIVTTGNGDMEFPHVIDFDGDGDLDVIGGSNNLHMLRNDGARTFSDIQGQTLYPRIIRGQAFGDFNHDGAIDIAQIDDANSQFTVWLAPALGALPPSVRLDTGS